jgi:hypothetical protein
MDNERFWRELRALVAWNVPDPIDPVAVVVKDELAASVLVDGPGNAVREMLATTGGTRMACCPAPKWVHSGKGSPRPDRETPTRH